MNWQISPHGNGWVAVSRNTRFFGNKTEVEQFLDLRESQRQQRIRERRAKRRMAKLLDWLYNHKK